MPATNRQTALLAIAIAGAFLASSTVATAQWGGGKSHGGGGGGGSHHGGGFGGGGFGGGGKSSGFGGGGNKSSGLGGKSNQNFGGNSNKSFGSNNPNTNRNNNNRNNNNRALSNSPKPLPTKPHQLGNNNLNNANKQSNHLQKPQAPNHLNKPPSAVNHAPKKSFVDKKVQGQPKQGPGQKNGTLSNNHPKHPGQVNQKSQTTVKNEQGKSQNKPNASKQAKKNESNKKQKNSSTVSNSKIKSAPHLKGKAQGLRPIEVADKNKTQAGGPSQGIPSTSLDQDFSAPFNGPMNAGVAGTMPSTVSPTVQSTIPSQGPTVKEAIVGGIVALASMAAEGDAGDAFMDSDYVGPGGGFVDDELAVDQGNDNSASPVMLAGPQVDEGGSPLVVESDPVVTHSPGIVGANTFTDNTSFSGVDAGVAEAGGRRVEAAKPVVAEPVVLVTPVKNTLPNQVTVADKAVRTKIGGEIDKQLTNTANAIVESSREQGLSEAYREKLFKDRITSEMDPTRVAELKNGLSDLDAGAVEASIKKLELGEVVLGDVVPRVKLSRALADLLKLVKNENDLEKVDAFAERFAASLSGLDLERGLRQNLQEAVVAVLDSLRIRLWINDPPDANPGSLIAAPEGEVSFVFYPPLAPAGKAYLLGEDVLAVGTATPGALVLGKGSVTDILGSPSLDGKQVEEITAEKALKAPRSGSLLICPRELAGPVNYQINGTAFSMRPGESQSLPAGATWVIDFSRGNGTHARYALEEGSYQFTADGNVRDIESETFEVTIENPSVTGRFHLVIDNDQVTIPPGQAISLTSAYPIVVGFDRGTTGEPVYKRLTAPRYSTSLRAEDGAWDLVEVEDNIDDAVATTAR